MTTVEIHRKSSMFYCGGIFGIYLDGKKVETIPNGGTKCLEIPSGEHQLEIRDAFGKKMTKPYTLKIQKGRGKKLQICSSYSCWAAPFASLLYMFSTMFEIKEL